MQLRRNLVSDSPLVQETIELLRLSGGHISAAEIVDLILKLPDLDAEVAALLVSDLIKDDHRLRINDSSMVELDCEDIETRALSKTEFVVVDVETTGAKTPPCRITEIGAYKINGGQIVDEFQTLVNPQTPIPAFIVSLTNITEEMVRDAPLFEEVAPRWLDFLGDAVIVAHNSHFDVRFINHEIARIFPGRRMINAHLCTVKLSRCIFPELPNHRLHTLAAHFEIPILNRHRAGDDALATAHIFLRMLTHLNDNGVHDVGAARRFTKEARDRSAQVAIL